MNSRCSNANGFTLMELMIALAILSVVIAGIVSSRFRQGEQNVTQLQAAEMQQSARAAMFIIKRELRTAGFNDMINDYGEGISAASPTSITFSSVADTVGTLDTIIYDHQDMDGDGDNDIGSNINGGGMNTLAENINVLLFEYFDGSGTAMAASPASPDDIRSVQITITAVVDSGHLSRDTDNNTRTLTARVWLRNMGI